MNIRDLKNDGNPEVKNNVEEKPREMKGMKFKAVDLHSVSRSGQRETVNFSEEMPEPTTGEFPGTIIKESIVEDILGPGGPFEEYKRQKLEEAKKFIAEQQAEAELEGKKIVDGGVDLQPIIPIEDLEQQEIESDGKTNNLIQMHPEQQRQNADPNFIYKVQEDDIFD